MTQLRTNPWYLWVAFVLPSVIILVQSIAPFEPTFKAQNLAVILGVIGAVIVAALWFPYVSKSTPTRPLKTLLALILLAWTIQTTLGLVDGYVQNHTTYFLPLLVILIYSKPPDIKALMVAGLVLGYSLTGIVLVSLFLGGNLGIPNGFEVPDNATSRFSILSQLFGIETRWGGPFGSVNYATPAGGLLVMLGIMYRLWNRWIFIVVGLVILFLGQARTTYFAIAIAILVLLLWNRRFCSWRYSQVIRSVTIGTALVTFVLYIVFIDPTFNGRTPIWVDYMSAVSESLLIGIGHSGVTKYVSQATASDPTGIYHLHAHSVYLDGLTRYGILWMGVTVGIFVVALKATWDSRRGMLASRGIAMVTFLILAGSTETIYSWTYVSVYVLALIYIVGISHYTEKPADLQEVGSPVKD